MAVSFKVFMVLLLVFLISTLFILGSVEGLEIAKNPSNPKKVDANRELALEELLKLDYHPHRHHPPRSPPSDAKKELAFDELLEPDYTPPRHHPPRSPPAVAEDYEDPGPNPKHDPRGRLQPPPAAVGV